MKKKLLTGLNKENFKIINNNDELLGCYICKRKKGDEGIFLFQNEECEDIGTQELDFGIFEFVRGNIIFQILLCDECANFLNSLVREFSNTSKPLETKAVTWN